MSPWHSSFSERELQRFEPSISTDQLKAAYLYHDAQVWSPERLTLEYLAQARASGADLRNHAAVDYIIVDGGRARGVDFHDVLTGRRSTASGRLIINAAGPWVDAVLDATGREMRRRIGGTRGSHLVVDLNGRGPRHAVLASARSDGRPMFVTPWLDHHIIGTTDVRDDEEPSDVRAAGWEIDYLVAEAARVLPGLGIEHRNVLYAYSGVRPLARAGEGVFEGAISRRSIIVDHSTEGVERLVSLVGGKLTTAEELGRTVAAAISAHIGRPRARGIAALPETPTSRAVFLPPETQEHLRMVYGPRAPEVAAYAASDASLGQTISPHHRDIGAQVAYAVEHEGARTVADVLLRRTAVGLTGDMGRRRGGRDRFHHGRAVGLAGRSSRPVGPRLLRGVASQVRDHGSDDRSAGVRAPAGRRTRRAVRRVATQACQRLSRSALVRTESELATIASAAVIGSNCPRSPNSQVSPPGTPPTASKIGTASPAASGMSRML